MDPPFNQKSPPLKGDLGGCSHEDRGNERGKGHQAPDTLPFRVEVTPGYQEAFDALDAGSPLVFITGRAGTGKSTFIHYFRHVTDKRTAVVAPTGVAALNAGGQTVHSFFRLPPRVIDPKNIGRVRGRTMYEKLEVLVIDEASMVRADVLDGIDRFLRINGLDPHAPFGGVQLVLVGDLFQLPPVAVAEERRLLEEMGYKTPYFFHARCMRTLRPAFIELTKIYRQENANFIELLNNIREKKDVEATIEEINRRCCNEYGDIDTDGMIMLTCTNYSAGRMNTYRLNGIEETEKRFEGEIQGEFNLENEKLPSPQVLILKPGARVMFTKNDAQGRWVNGTPGEVIGFDHDMIQVRTGRDMVDVERTVWEKVEYAYDEDSDCIVADVAGMYIQFPLMLAWAITIHKSQGKTLRNVYIDLGRGAFETGQLYVALSRCPALEDITLHRPITAADVKMDGEVVKWHEGMRG